MSEPDLMGACVELQQRVRTLGAKVEATPGPIGQTLGKTIDMLKERLDHLLEALQTGEATRLGMLGFPITIRPADHEAAMRAHVAAMTKSYEDCVSILEGSRFL